MQKILGLIQSVLVWLSLSSSPGFNPPPFLSSNNTIYEYLPAKHNYGISDAINQSKFWNWIAQMTKAYQSINANKFTWILFYLSWTNQQNHVYPITYLCWHQTNTLGSCSYSINTRNSKELIDVHNAESQLKPPNLG